MPELAAPPKPAPVKPKEPVETREASPLRVSWGPITAVVVTVVLFVLSQIVGSIIILSVAKGKGLSGDALAQWLDQAWPEFFYIFIVEAVMLGSLALFLRRYKASFKTLGMIKPAWRDLGFALLGFGIYFGLLIGVMAAVKAMFPQIDFDQEQQVGFSTAHGRELILVFVSLVVLPPISEEIMTRGFLYLGLRTRMHVIPAAILTSLIFATAHLQWGSGAPLLWTAAIDTFVLSLVLVWLREKTGALWASIGLHMIKNGLAFLALFVFVH